MGLLMEEGGWNSGNNQETAKEKIDFDQKKRNLNPMSIEFTEYFTNLTVQGQNNDVCLASKAFVLFWRHPTLHSRASVLDRLRLQPKLFGCIDAAPH